VKGDSGSHGALITYLSEISSQPFNIGLEVVKVSSINGIYISNDWRIYDNTFIFPIQIPNLVEDDTWMQLAITYQRATGYTVVYKDSLEILRQ